MTKPHGPLVKVTHPRRPVLRILTLGRFQVVRDGRPLAWRRKAPRRPLELLKAVIAFSRPEVPGPQLAEALWPDADGDRAMQAFESTLYRLRHVLGDRRGVLLRDGQLSLDPDRVWVDAMAFEAFLRCPETIEQGLALYQGRFLEGTEAPWVLPRREALHQTFLDQLDQLAQRHVGARRREQAIAWYQRGLEIDPLAEVCYRRLMAAYLQLGRRAEGLMVYRRCRTMLETHMGVAPSKETEMLARQLRAGPRDIPPNR